jgi:hypothetical protein
VLEVSGRHYASEAPGIQESLLVPRRYPRLDQEGLPHRRRQIDSNPGGGAQRGVLEQNEFAILTAEISKATFGVTPAQYKQLKGLERENLRDHMTDLELIFTMLGEAATTEIARNKDAQGFDPNKVAAQEGGTVAGNARRQLEARSGRRVVTRRNYLLDKPIPKRLPRIAPE